MKKRIMFVFYFFLMLFFSCTGQKKYHSSYSIKLDEVMSTIYIDMPIDSFAEKIKHLETRGIIYKYMYGFNIIRVRVDDFVIHGDIWVIEEDKKVKEINYSFNLSKIEGRSFSKSYFDDFIEELKKILGQNYVKGEGDIYYWTDKGLILKIELVGICVDIKIKK